MIAHERPVSNGITDLRFSTSLGTPVEGLHYRLGDGRGRTHAGITSADGAGARLHTHNKGSATHVEEPWLLDGNVILSLEVRRDDGSWALIGSFQHEASIHKQVNIIAPAIAVPLQMEPI